MPSSMCEVLERRLQLSAAPTATLHWVSDQLFFGDVSDPGEDVASIKYNYDFNNDGVFDISTSSPASVTIPQSILTGPNFIQLHGQVVDADGGANDYHVYTPENDTYCNVKVLSMPAKVGFAQPFKVKVSLTDLDGVTAPPAGTEVKIAVAGDPFEPQATAYTDAAGVAVLTMPQRMALGSHQLIVFSGTSDKAKVTLNVIKASGNLALQAGGSTFVSGHSLTAPTFNLLTNAGKPIFDRKTQFRISLEKAPTGVKLSTVTVTSPDGRRVGLANRILQKAGSYTYHISAPGYVSGTADIYVMPGTATHFSVTAPKKVKLGDFADPKFFLLDQFGNRTYTAGIAGTVTLKGGPTQSTVLDDVNFSFYDGEADPYLLASVKIAGRYTFLINIRLDGKNVASASLVIDVVR